MTLQVKDVQFKTQAVQPDGFFCGYGNVFDVADSYGEIVRKGAFSHSLQQWEAQGKLPPVLWNHDRNQPIGVWTNLKEDEHGLYGEGRLLINEVARAKEIHALLLAGAIDGLSIGYRLNKWAYHEQDEALELLDIDLKEISIVTFPANEQSRIERVKSTLVRGSLPTLPEFEKALRELGFSKTQATAVAGYGLRKLHQGEPEQHDIGNALTILKSIHGETYV